MWVRQVEGGYDTHTGGEAERGDRGDGDTIILDTH